MIREIEENPFGTNTRLPQTIRKLMAKIESRLPRIVVGPVISKGESMQNAARNPRTK
jgi:hypothetical protein